MDTNVISFFSYKGGAGRSTLAYNIIPILAAEHLHPTKEHPIIIVDMDIDSCGMSYLLEVENQIRDDCCVQQMLSEGCSNKVTATIREHPNFQNLCAVGKKFGYHDDEAILFLPAKDVKNVDNNSSNYNDANNPFQRNLGSFIENCEHFGVPAVILDSAVGNNATANAANQVSNIIVCCMRPTTQFVNGTVRFLETLHSSSSPVKGRKKIVVVPNVVPQERIVIDGHKYPDLAIDRIINKFDPLLDKQKPLGISYEVGMMKEDEFGVPAAKSFMWREGQLYTQDTLAEDEKLVLTRYKKLAALIGDHCK